MIQQLVRGHVPECGRLDAVFRGVGQAEDLTRNAVELAFGGDPAASRLYLDRLIAPHCKRAVAAVAEEIVSRPAPVSVVGGALPGGSGEQKGLNNLHLVPHHRRTHWRYFRRKIEMLPGAQSKNDIPTLPHAWGRERQGGGQNQAGGRQNNFDALRLVAAISVIFSHSFLIAEGTQNNEPLIWLTGNQSILGLAGVFVFFAISGFLVTQSFEETGNAWRFLAKRALRIFPGLFVAAAVSAFVLGPLVTDLPLGVYLNRPEPYEYVIGNTLLDQRVHELPGVWFVDNQVGLEVNGSLWTLRLEFTMYLMVLALGVLRLLTVRAALLLLTFGMACLHFNMLDELEKWGWFFQLLSGWGWLVGFFAAGMVLYKLRHTRIFDGRIALLAFAGLVLSVPLRQFILLFPLFGCYLALWLALTPRLPVIPAARFGDLSYGIYIYGWPVEQGVVWLLGGRAAWWQVFLLALPAAAALAFLSWHLVERPALRLKPAARRSPALRRDAGVEVGPAVSMASIGQS